MLLFEHHPNDFPEAVLEQMPNPSPDRHVRTESMFRQGQCKMGGLRLSFHGEP